MENNKHLNYTMNILERGKISAGVSWNYLNVTSPFNRLYLILDGECYLQRNNTIYNLKPNTTYLIPANNTFSYVCPNYMSKYYFHFNLEIMFGFDIFSEVKEVLSFPTDKELLNAIEDNFNNPNFKNSVRLKGTLETMLSNFIDNNYQTNKNLYYYKDILNYIEKNLSAKLRLNNKKDKSTKNHYELSRKFKIDTGITLKEYQEKLLIKRVKEDLIIGDLSIKETAAKYSFCDPYYLSRFFKKFEGMSPAAYKEKNKFK